MTMVDALSILLTVEGLLSATIALAFSVGSDAGLRQSAAGAARTIGRIATLGLVLIAVGAFAAWLKVADNDWSLGLANKLVLGGLLLGIVSLPAITAAVVYYGTRQASGGGAVRL